MEMGIARAERRRKERDILKGSPVVQITQKPVVDNPYTIRSVTYNHSVPVAEVNRIINKIVADYEKKIEETITETEYITYVSTTAAAMLTLHRDKRCRFGALRCQRVGKGIYNTLIECIDNADLLEQFKEEMGIEFDPHNPLEPITLKEPKKRRRKPDEQHCE